MLTHYSKHIAKTATRRKCVTFLTFVVVWIITFLQTDWSPDLYFLNWFVEDVSCYYSKANDALPAIDEKFTTPEKSIHFHETSCRGRLNSRQACAIESAARTHPGWQINVFFAGSVTEESLDRDSLKVLKKYENIRFMRLHLLDYARGTPMEKCVEDGVLNRTRWRFSHTSDALRYLTLYKWGGIYLDLDVVVVKSLEGLVNNWAARESDIAVAAGALSFSHDELGRQVAEDAIRDFVNNFRGDDWGHNGPGVITRMLRRMCSTRVLSEMTAETCKGFEVYGPELFYPIGWRKAQEYFEEKEIPEGNVYSYHVWNKFTYNTPITAASMYGQLARKYCPEVYEAFGDKFGS